MCCSDGKATMMHCGGSPFGCRICNDCRFKDEESEDARTSAGQFEHTCPHPADMRLQCKKSGHDLLVLPDLGVGREEFEKHGRIWGKSRDGEKPWWSIQEQKHVDALMLKWRDEECYFQDPRSLIEKVYEDMEEMEGRGVGERAKASRSIMSAQNQGANREDAERESAQKGIDQEEKGKEEEKKMVSKNEGERESKKKEKKESKKDSEGEKMPEPSSLEEGGMDPGLKARFEESIAKAMQEVSQSDVESDKTMRVIKKLLIERYGHSRESVAENKNWIKRTAVAFWGRQEGSGEEGGEGSSSPGQGTVTAVPLGGVGKSQAGSASIQKKARGKRSRDVPGQETDLERSPDGSSARSTRRRTASGDSLGVA